MKIMFINYQFLNALFWHLLG